MREPVETLPSEQGLKREDRYAVNTSTELLEHDPVETLPSEQGLKRNGHRRHSAGKGRPVETLPSEQGLKLHPLQAVKRFYDGRSKHFHQNKD